MFPGILFCYKYAVASLYKADDFSCPGVLSLCIACKWGLNSVGHMEDQNNKIWQYEADTLT